MVKHFMALDQYSITISATGNKAMTNCLPTTSLTSHLDGLCEEQDVLGIHKAKLIVRVSATAGHQGSFAGRLIMYMTDGGVASYTPGAVTDLEQLEIWLLVLIPQEIFPSRFWANPSLVLLSKLPKQLGLMHIR